MWVEGYWYPVMQSGSLVGTGMAMGPRPDRDFLHLTRNGSNGCVRSRALNLALLIHTESHRVVGRVHIQAHDVAHFLDQLRVRRQLEGFAAVRLQAEGMPDSVDRHSAEPSGLLPNRACSNGFRRAACFPTSESPLSERGENNFRNRILA